MHHEDHAIGTIRRALATPYAFGLVHIDLASGITADCVAGRAIRETERVLAMATGGGNLQSPEKGSLMAVQTRLAVVRRRAGLYTVITPNTLGLVNQQDIGPLKDAPLQQFIKLAWPRRSHQLQGLMLDEPASHCLTEGSL